MDYARRQGREVIGAREIELLGEAARWRLLGLLFERPGPAWRGQVEGLMSEVDDPLLGQAAGSAIEDASEGLFHSIFGPGGPAPAREVSYVATLQPGQLLAELATYYDSFAYRPATEEPPDHVSVELGFLAFLRMKEAYALASGDAGNAEVTAQAAARFLEDHLKPMLKALAGSLASSGVRYLELAGEAVAAAARA